MSEHIEGTLIPKVRAALKNDQELAKLVIRELSDKQDLLDRVEDVISERSELSQALEIAQIQIEDLAAKADQVETLNAEVLRLKSEGSGKSSPGPKLSEDAFGANGAASAADYQEMLEECEGLRQARKDLEDELMLRDEIIASLKDDFQGTHGGSSGNADFDALMQEKNNLSEQLSLSLSQLEQVTDKDGMVARVDRLTDQAEELQVRLEQSLAENNHLQNKLDEARDQLKGAALGKPEAAPSHSTGAVLTVVILILLVGFIGMRATSPSGKPVKVSGAAGNRHTQAQDYVLPVSEIEEVALERLKKQQATLSKILALRSPEREPSARVVEEGIEEALESADPYRRALAEIANGQFPEGLTSIKAAFEAHKLQEARLCYIQGRTNFFAGHIADATRLLRKSVEMSPNLVAGWRSLGDLYVFQDNVEQATFCYNEALKADEEDALTLAALGSIYSLNDEIRKAINYFNKSVISDSSLTESWYALGMLYQRAEDFGKAAKSLEKAIALEPENAQTHYALSQCYRILQKEDLSKHHRERALNLGYQEVGPVGQ